MLNAHVSRVVDIETLAREIAALLSHYRSARGRDTFSFLGTDPYPRLLSLTRATVDATIRLDANHSPAVSRAFAELGALAPTLDGASLMVACTDTLQLCERHIGRACPDLLSDAAWIPHWTNLNLVACRGAIFGQRRRSFTSETEWAQTLDDASVPRLTGVRGCRVGSDDDSGEELILAASSRVDGGIDAVIGTNVSGTIVYWNRRATDLYGWSASEVMGENIIDVTPSLQSRRDAELIMRELLSGRPWSGQFLCKAKSGNPLRTYVTDIPVFRLREIVGVLGLSGPRASR
jgi:PAS domain S-box-containing protein